MASDGITYPGSNTGGGRMPELGKHTGRQVARAVLGGVPAGGRVGRFYSAISCGANAAAGIMGRGSL